MAPISPCGNLPDSLGDFARSFRRECCRLSWDLPSRERSMIPWMMDGTKTGACELLMLTWCQILAEGTGCD